MKRPLRILLYLCAIGLLSYFDSKTPVAANVSFTFEELLPDGSNLDLSNVLETSWNPGSDDVFAAGVNWFTNPENFSFNATGVLVDRNNSSPGAETFAVGANTQDAYFDFDGNQAEDPLHDAIEGIVFANSFDATISNLAPNSDYRIQFISWDAGVELEATDINNRVQTITVVTPGFTGALDFNQFVVDGPDNGGAAGNSSDEITAALVTAMFTTGPGQTEISFNLQARGFNDNAILNAILVHNESLEAPQLGDIDGDGDVDLEELFIAPGDTPATDGISDANILRDTLGDLVSPSEGADLDADGRVTLLDFRILKDLLPAGTSASSALSEPSSIVPEPATNLLILTSGLVLISVYRPRLQLRKSLVKQAAKFAATLLFVLSVPLSLKVQAQSAPVATIITTNPTTPAFTQVTDYDVNADPDQPFNEGALALATTAVNSAARANPNAKTDQGRVMALIAAERFGTSNSQSTNSLEQYTFTNWQYVDRFVDWGGTSEGNILIPRSGWIDAAHRNGTKIFGNIFIAPSVFGGTASQVNFLVQQDGNLNYTVADRLIEVAEKQGFDGYFLNQEFSGVGSATAEQVGQFMEYFQANSNLELIWYDAMTEGGFVGWQDQLNSQNDRFFQNNGQVVAESMFLDFGANASRLTSSKTVANNLGRSEFDLYAGALLPGGLAGGAGQLEASFNGPSGNHRSSLGLFAPEEVSFLAATANPDFDIQAMIEEDSKLYVGANGDPSDTSNPVSGTNWRGIANYVAAKTPLTKDTFVTNFNFGLGTHYAIDGAVSSNQEWNNIGLQDVLPTWRWRVQTSDATPLEASFDFEDAYHGGNSIKVAGSLDENTDLPLYLAKVPVHADSKLTFTYKTGEIGDSSAELLVTFEGDEANPTAIPIGATTNEGWNNFTADLSGFNGQTIASLGLRFSDNDDQNYQINVGRLGVIRGEVDIPAPPTNATAQSVSISTNNQVTADVRLLWDHSTDYSRDQNNGIYNYNVFRREEDGSRTFLGGAATNAFFVDNIPRNGQELVTTLEVEAVGNEFGVSTAEEFKVRWETNAVLLIDRNTGLASIANALGENIELTEYGIFAASGVLNGGDSDWNSLADQGAPGWSQSSASNTLLQESTSGTPFTMGSDTALELGSIYNRTELAFGMDDEDILLAYRDNGAVVSGNVIFLGDSANNLTLTINTDTGNATIENTSTFDATIDAYQILSEAGSLDPSTWTSLEDQSIVGWEEANPSANQLSEVNFTSTLLIESGQTLDLGKIFLSGMAKDIAFEFLLNGATDEISIGRVIYQSSDGLGGDFDGDGDVDGADFLQWQRDGRGLSDLAQWQQQYGNSLSSISSLTVPEPSCVALLVFAHLLFSSCSRS